MPKKKRRGGFSQPGAAEAAADRRWSAGSAELAEQQEEQAELQFGAPDEGAGGGGGAMAGSAVAAAGALDDEEWPSLPKRPRSEPVVEPKRGELPWDQLDGSARPGKALHEAAKRIWDEIEAVGNPNGSDKKRRHIEERIDQLVAATFNRKEALDSLARMEQPNATHQAIATGVAAKLQEMRDSSVHRQSLGRLCYDALFAAATAKLPDFPQVSVAQVAGALNVHRNTVYAALDRSEQVAVIGGVVLLDPARAQRKDATSLTTINAIQGFWAGATRASPDKRPIAVMDDGKGGKVTHGIHWQERTLSELYDLYCSDAQNPPVSKEIFRRHKPFFIRKPRWRGCLCPRCHVLRLLIDALCDVLKDCVSEDNKCPCAFCKKHKTLATTAATDSELSYPPESATSLSSAMMCPKLEALPESGFTGTMPTYELCCIRNRLEGTQDKFITNKKDNPAELPNPPEKCSKCADKFPLSPPPECQFVKENKTVMYKHYVKTPRLGTSDKSEREDLQVVDVTRTEFLATLRSQLSEVILHKYVADWQDATSELVIEMRKPGHAVCGLDFAMNHTCVPKEELKQEFWNRTQVSLHPMLTYEEWPMDWETVCHPGEKEKTKRAEKMMQAHIFMSDDPKHDTCYVDDNMRELMPLWHARRSSDNTTPLTWLTMLSDNGPAHYKCCRSFYNLTCWAAELGPTECGLCRAPAPVVPGASAAAAAATVCPPADPGSAAACAHLGQFYMDWMFLAPDHGKSVWDGISGLTKNQLSSGELNRKKGDLPLCNCERCVDHLEARKRKKEVGFERYPFPVRAGSLHSLELTEYYKTEYDKLALARTRLKDATTVSGSGSHYHLRAVGRGRLQMRWLGCPCAACWRRDDDACANKDRCGTWVDRTVSVSEQPGIAALSAFRKLKSEQIAAAAEVGDFVATWTSEDVTSRRQYWVGQVTHVAFNVGTKGGITCSSSGQHFNEARGDTPGEHVLKVRWLDRVGLAAQHDCIFHTLHTEEYIVHVSTLRAGKIEMGQPAASPTRNARPRLTLSGSEHARIMHAIEKEFKDE